MRLLEIGECPYVSPFLPGRADFFSVTPNEFPRLTFPRLREVSGRLRQGDYDLVIYHIAAKVHAPWHRPQPLWRRLWRAGSRSHELVWHFFHRALLRTEVPLAIIDRQDVPRLTETESHWLDRARFWFMRELPPNHLNLFLNMNRRCGDVVNIGRQEIVRRNLEKIEPFGLGFDPAETRDVPPQEKIHDIFYAGANHTSTVRQRGVEELPALAAKGVRVFIPETRLPRDEFFRECARSWLVWSPEGQGWDCYRHYEALMLGAVPMINFPTVEHLHALRHGEHCLHYRPETGGLIDAVESALTNRTRLREIAAAGRAHALQHLTHARLIAYALGKMGVVESELPVD